MNEQLQQAVTTMIQQALEAFNKGASFMAAEIPDVVNQLLMWHAIRSAAMTALGVLILVVFVVTSYYQVKWWVAKDPNSRYDERRINMAYGSAVLLNLIWILPVAFAISIINLTWLQIWIAPKVWLIEYAARMIK